MKMRTINLTPRFLIESLQGKAASVVSNLPRDLELLDIKIDLQANQLTAVVRSNNFEEFEERYPLPEFNLIYKEALKSPPAAQTSSQAKGEHMATMALKRATSAAAEGEHRSLNAIKVAGEFSPDQRELLSFEEQGDFVIVKPTKFLKEEWEEINEVVRSLNGRWVKGDIISYWQIPLT